MNRFKSVLVVTLLTLSFAAAANAEIGGTDPEPPPPTTHSALTTSSYVAIALSALGM